MPTIKILLSSYTEPSSSGAVSGQVINPSNAYTDINSTTYATIDSEFDSNGTFETSASCFKFSLTDIPKGAKINSATIKVKCYFNVTGSRINEPYLELTYGSARPTLGTIPYSQMGTVQTFSKELSSAAINNFLVNKTSLSLWLECSASPYTGETCDVTVRLYGAELIVDYTPQINGYANIDGVNKELTGGYVNIGGAWKELVGGYINIGGVWKEMS